ncbi:MAG: hypothetical protein ACLQPD_11230 [Desulfomonilaceae bacterium]
MKMLDHWIVLRVRCVSEALWITYEDDAGTRRDLPHDSRDKKTAWSTVSTDLLAHLWTSDLPHYSIRVPSDLENLLRTAVSFLPPQPADFLASASISVPIFVDAPPEMPNHPWATIVEQLPPINANPDRIQTIYLGRNRWFQRPGFRMPLRVLAVGARCGDSLKAIQSASWYINDPTVQTYGLPFETVEFNAVSNALRTETRDIVLVEDKMIENLLKSAARLRDPSTTRPRLVIVLSEEYGKPYPPQLSVPPYMVLLWINPAGAGIPVDQFLVATFIDKFFDGIIHNYPLHQALKAATRDMSYISRPYVFLSADPKSNNYLRLSDAVTQIHREDLTLKQTVARGDLDAFFERMGDDATHELRLSIKKAFEKREAYRDIQRETYWDVLTPPRYSTDFKHDITSLGQLAHAEASLAAARQAAPKIRAIFAPITSRKKHVEKLEKHQDRRVDVALEYLNYEAMIYQPIEPNRKLIKGAYYRLRVHIGRPSPDSLMTSEPPPLDPLLPEPEGEEGHSLEVVVFEKDFTLLSERVQFLQLPPLRGSEPVYFEVLAPQLDTGELRIGIYHKNHLLQSFILEAEIGNGECIAGSKKQVKVRLNFSRTARFTNLHELGPRALSIGVNQNRGETAHSFMLKLNNEALPLDFTEGIIKEQLSKFRKKLQDASVNSSGGCRFPAFPGPGAASSSEFQGIIRDLADLGGEIYESIYTHSKKMQKELGKIAAQADRTIQIVRHDPNFAFPWSVVYDFKLPDKIAGASPPPVCLGIPEGESAFPKTADKIPTKLCSHGPEDNVYCIYGFWGLRHRIEQLIALGDSLEDGVNRVKPNPHYGVCLAVGEKDAHTAHMTTELLKSLGTAVFQLAQGDELLDILWEPQKRPAILVALGHFETANICGEPIGPRIVLQPKKKWLRAKSVTDRQRSGEDWGQPRTLILLMACGSAATEITTLNDLVIAFTSAGAAAIAGTECVVFSRLVARFAQEITIDLWNRTPLGEAVKNFNRRLVSSGNPLAFVFNYIGDADLQIVT